MDETRVFAIVVLLAAAAIAAAWLYLHRQGESVRLSPWQGAAFILVTAGVLVGKDGWLGSLLAGLGVLIAVADIARRRRRG